MERKPAVKAMPYHNKGDRESCNTRTINVRFSLSIAQVALDSFASTPLHIGCACSVPAHDHWTSNGPQAALMSW